MNRTYVSLCALLLVSFTLVACDSNPQNMSEVRVYSARANHLIQPIFDAFSADTGIKVSYLSDKAGPLLERMRAEGSRTKADLLLTVDAGNLWWAKQAGLLQAVDSAVLDRNVPGYLRDPEGYWYGLSLRARVIVYHKERVRRRELTDGYVSLAHRRWNNRLCLRTSKKVYNQSMVAAMIIQYGEKTTLEVLKGWVDNLSLAPFSSDTQALQAVLAGNCDATIVNTYYLARIERDWNSRSGEFPLAVHIPPANSDGVHINISGIALSKHAENVDAAIRLMEWLSSKRAQHMYALPNLEYPVDEGVEVAKTLRAWGDLPFNDKISVAEYGALQQKSIELMDSVGYR